MHAYYNETSNEWKSNQFPARGKFARTAMASSPIVDTLPNIFFLTTFRFYVLTKRTTLIPLLLVYALYTYNTSALYTVYKLKKNVIILNFSKRTNKISYIRFYFLGISLNTFNTNNNNTY